jgi:hypothetical protein
LRSDPFGDQMKVIAAREPHLTLQVMGPNVEEVDELLRRTATAVRLSRWAVDELWESVRKSIAIVYSTHELLERSDKDLLRFRTLGCIPSEATSPDELEESHN